MSIAQLRARPRPGAIARPSRPAYRAVGAEEVHGPHVHCASRLKCSSDAATPWHQGPAPLIARASGASAQPPQRMRSVAACQPGRTRPAAGWSTRTAGSRWRRYHRRQATPRRARRCSNGAWASSCHGVGLPDRWMVEPKPHAPADGLPARHGVRAPRAHGAPRVARPGVIEARMPQTPGWPAVREARRAPGTPAAMRAYSPSQSITSGMAAPTSDMGP